MGYRMRTSISSTLEHWIVDMLFKNLATCLGWMPEFGLPSFCSIPNSKMGINIKLRVGVVEVQSQDNNMKHVVCKFNF